MSSLGYYPCRIPKPKASSTTRGMINGPSTQATSITGTSGSQTPASSSFIQQPPHHRGPSPYTSATYPLAPDWMSPVPWQGTIATDSPALRQSVSMSSYTESDYSSETSINGGESALRPISKEKSKSDTDLYLSPRSNAYASPHMKSNNPTSSAHLDLNPNMVSKQGLGLAICQDQTLGKEKTQPHVDKPLPQLPEWPMLVEWVCNNHPVKVFRDSGGVFAVSSFLLSSFDDTEELSQPPFLSITRIDTGLTWRDVIERLELSRSISVERGVSRHTNTAGSLAPVKTVSLAFKSMKVRFDIPGGRTAEIQLLPLDTQEVKEVWNLVLARGGKDLLVVEYEIVGEDENLGTEASATSTELTESDLDEQEVEDMGDLDAHPQVENERRYKTTEKSAATGAGQQKGFLRYKQAGGMRRRFRNWVSGRGSDGTKRSAIV